MIMMTMMMVTMTGNVMIISHPGMACVDEKEKDGREWSFHHSCLHVPWLRFETSQIIRIHYLKQGLEICLY